MSKLIERVVVNHYPRYPASGSDLLLGLLLARCARDDGTQIWPSVETLARMTRQSPRSVQRQLARIRKSGWLILVKQGHGGRGHAAEYRIDPLWITNHVKLTPFAGHGGERVTNEAIKGDKRGIERVTSLSPQLLINAIKTTTTAPFGAFSDDAEPVDALIWPKFLSQQQRDSCARFMNRCPPEQRQDVLDEVAGIHDKKGVEHPVALVSTLVDRAVQGSFALSAGLDGQLRRLAMEKAKKEGDHTARNGSQSNAASPDPAILNAVFAKLADWRRETLLKRPDRGIGNTKGA